MKILFHFVLLFCFQQTLKNVNALKLTNKKAKYSNSYSCKQTCDDGDVTYTLVAKISTLPIKNEKANIKEDFFTRTWYGGDEQTGEKVGLLGPTLKVKPGQQMNIMVKNEIDTRLSKKLGPKPPGLDSYLAYNDPSDVNNRYRGMQPYGFTFTNKVVKNASDFKIVGDIENIPHDYDNINIHVHGMMVAPHIFFPQGTADPDSEYISIKPGECYCYRFDIPKDHPTGLYWYHPHRHGSISIQAWSGMAGLLQVEGLFDEELKELGVSRSFPAVIWDPHFRRIDDHTIAARAKLATDYFLKDQTDNTDVRYFLNGQYQPTFQIFSNELINIRLLCATTENLSAFRIIDARNKSVEFAVVASDGVAYEKSRMNNLLVVSGGQREEILIKIEEPGLYSIVTDGLEHMQFFNTGPANQTLGYIRVIESKIDSLKTIPLSMVRTTPGMKKPIEPSEITKFRTFVFDIHADSSIVPFPQFFINNKAYNVKRIDSYLEEGSVEEWTLINPNWAVHPFHIHVYSFYVSSVSSAFMQGNPYQYAQAEQSVGTWRDVVNVPPNSIVKIWIRFDAPSDIHNGKSVYHCHFEAHSDTGMISNMMLLPKTEKQKGKKIEIKSNEKKITQLSFGELLMNFIKNTFSDFHSFFILS